MRYDKKEKMFRNFHFLYANEREISLNFLIEKENSLKYYLTLTTELLLKMKFSNTESLILFLNKGDL